KDEQRFENGQNLRVPAGVKVWENRQYGEQVADQMTAGVAEESAGAGKIVRKKTQQRAGANQRNQSHEILSRRGGNQGEAGCGNGSETRAKTVHVVHEIERIGDGEDPEDCDGVAEKGAVNKQRNPHARRGHEQGDETLTAEFRR